MSPSEGPEDRGPGEGGPEGEGLPDDVFSGLDEGFPWENPEGPSLEWGTPGYLALWETIDAELAEHPEGPPEWGPEWKAFLVEYRAKLAAHGTPPLKRDPPEGPDEHDEGPFFR